MIYIPDWIAVITMFAVIWGAYSLFGKEPLGDKIGLWIFGMGLAILIIGGMQVASLLGNYIQITH